MLIVRTDLEAGCNIIVESYESPDDESIESMAEALFLWAKEKGRLCSKATKSKEN